MNQKKIFYIAAALITFTGSVFSTNETAPAIALAFLSQNRMKQLDDHVLRKYKNVVLIDTTTEVIKSRENYLLEHYKDLTIYTHIINNPEKFTEDHKKRKHIIQYIEKKHQTIIPIVIYESGSLFYEKDLEKIKKPNSIIFLPKKPESPKSFFINAYIALSSFFANTPAYFSYLLRLVYS